jgi:hypothetical protein
MFMIRGAVVRKATLHGVKLICKGLLEPGQVAMTLDPAEPKFAVQQRRGYAALLLATGPPVIDFKYQCTMIFIRSGTEPNTFGANAQPPMRKI